MYARPLTGGFSCLYCRVATFISKDNYARKLCKSDRLSRQKYDSSFSGIVIDTYGNIAYYKYGTFHRADGPAIIYSDKNPFFDGAKKYSWIYKNHIYGKDDKYSIESWKKQVEIIEKFNW